MIEISILSEQTDEIRDSWHVLLLVGMPLSRHRNHQGGFPLQYRVSRPSTTCCSRSNNCIYIYISFSLLYIVTLVHLSTKIYTKRGILRRGWKNHKLIIRENKTIEIYDKELEDSQGMSSGFKIDKTRSFSEGVVRRL